MKINKDLDNLLKRTNLNDPFETFLESVQKNFPSIGVINNYLPINEGYEDANIIINSNAGKFVLKIFLEERKLENIYSYVKILNECKSVGVQTIEILTDFNNGLGFTENNGVKTYYIITKFFEGSNFQNVMPTMDDIKTITLYISKLNTLDFEVGSTYDSWGIKNFAKEYEKKKGKLAKEQNDLIINIFEEFIKIDMSNISKSIIHGDMQRKHVIRNENAEYCILDFGCMAYDPKVIELSTYLAWFCLQEDTWEDRDLIYKTVLAIYNNTHHLSNEEIDSIPTLIRTSYAAYYLTTCVMMNEGDTSAETIEWNNKAKKMLELTKNWNVKRLE